MICEKLSGILRSVDLLREDYLKTKDENDGFQEFAKTLTHETNLYFDKDGTGYCGRFLELIKNTCKVMSLLKDGTLYPWHFSSAKGGRIRFYNGGIFRSNFEGDWSWRVEHFNKKLKMSMSPEYEKGWRYLKRNTQMFKEFKYFAKTHLIPLTDHLTTSTNLLSNKKQPFIFNFKNNITVSFPYVLDLFLLNTNRFWFAQKPIGNKLTATGFKSPAAHELKYFHGIPLLLVFSGYHGIYKESSRYDSDFFWCMLYELMISKKTSLSCDDIIDSLKNINNSKPNSATDTDPLIEAAEQYMKDTLGKYITMWTLLHGGSNAR